MTRVLLVELNEVSLDLVRAYGPDRLPVLTRLMDVHGVIKTTSEARYEEWEPWIQWVTAHTGKSLAEHGVFRLGDIVAHDHEQVWERLEAAGYRVGAISPMNANNRLRDPAFFIPDPWTETKASGSFLLRKLHTALRQAVNDNAEARTDGRSLLWLALAALRYSNPQRLWQYARIAAAPRQAWARTLILDALLSDIFVAEVRLKRPDFASLFLNGAAHLQHHFMFCSAVYGGLARNPEWYIRPGVDPLLAVYQLYDKAVGRIQDLCKPSRLLLATGLHQEPHDQLTFYWRPTRHEAFLRHMGAPFEGVEPRMSRDFLVRCGDAAEAAAAEALLHSIRVSDGERLFEVDNRGADLFVTTAYPHLVGDETRFTSGNRDLGALRPHLSFVAIKNGEHDGIGYLIDSGRRGATETIPLSNLPDIVHDAVAGRPH